MKRFINYTYILSVLLVVSIVLIGCGTLEEKDQPEEKMALYAQAMDSTNFYDILEEYPGMESLFTYGDMDIETFEEKCFLGVLADSLNADTIVEMVEGLPPLFNSRSVPKKIFENDLEIDMGNKGAIQDMLCSFSCLTRNILSLNEEQVVPFYDFLDLLNEKEDGGNGGKETTEYIVELWRNKLDYLSTLDDDDVNTYMHLYNLDLIEKQIPEDRKLDVADQDVVINDFSSEAASGLAKIIVGIKPLFYDEEIKASLKGYFHSLGNFLGDKGNQEKIKELLINLEKYYGKDNLGNLLDRAWNSGPIVGPVIEEMDIEGYGKDGKQEHCLRDLLMCPKLINTILESFYSFYKAGYKMDHVDDQVIKLVNSDPLCFPRDGEGEYGNGEFYEPSDSFSYKNFSALRGMLAMATRANVPLTFTTNFLFECEGGEDTKALIRNLMEGADSFPLCSVMWQEVYEKGDGYAFGHGKPVKEKKGYGLMIDGTYVAPVNPAVVAAGNIMLCAIGDSIYNGPYDNIYDNLRWMSTQRKFYVVTDVVQIVQHIPSIRKILMPVFNSMGIKNLPIVIAELTGMNAVFLAEFGELITNLPQSITLGLVKAGLPENLVDRIINMINLNLPLGTPVEVEGGETKIFWLSQDQTDLFCLYASFPYFDHNAFHLDRYLDRKHPDNFARYYDVSGYTYEKDKDKANRMADLIAPLCVAGYLAFQETTDGIPLNEPEEMRKAGKEAFNGVVYPLELVLNLATSLTEISTEKHLYEIKDTEALPFVGLFEPLLAMESKGLLDSVLELLCLLGKPELREARMNILEGLSEIVSTIDKDTTGVYAYAGELISTPIKASDDPRYWDVMKMDMDKTAALYSKDSPYQIVDTIIDLIGHITSVDISEDEWEAAAQGIVELLGSSTGEKIISRIQVDYSNIIDHLDSTQSWSDILYLIKDVLEEDGVLAYVLLRLEKDPDVSWENILSDMDRFLRSDIMIQYGEGSFWRDIYHLVNFMSDVFGAQEM